MSRVKPNQIKDAEAYLSKEDVLKIRPSKEFQRKYEVVKKIGNGAFAEVFLVRDRATGQEYAAKVVDRTAVTSPKHLWGELHVLYHLDHPAIVHLYDAFASDRHLLMLLDYAKGGELYDRIVAREEYDEYEAMSVIRVLLDAVRYLHEHKIVHRDIKPENILFMDESEESLKLTDFGLSGVLKSDLLLFTCAGTPGFMAPEVLKGGSGTGYDAACDMWSIGVLAYLLLSGTMPFKSEAPFEMYRKILRAEYEFGSSFDAVSDEAKDFIRKCLVAEPKDRITAENARKHEWFAEEQATRARGLPPECRTGLLHVLEERRVMKQYKPTGIAVSFLAKMKAKAKLAKNKV